MKRTTVSAARELATNRAATSDGLKTETCGMNSDNFAQTSVPSNHDQTSAERMRDMLRPLLKDFRPTSLVICLFLLSLLPHRLPAQDDSESLEELRGRIQRLELELQRLKISGGTRVPDDPASQRVLMLVENPFLGSLGYSSNGQSRFLVGKLIVVNLTSQPIKIAREQIQLESNGELETLQDIPNNYLSRSFRQNNQSMYLRNMRPAAEVTARPGGTASTWFFFTKLPGNNEVPKMSLKVKMGDDVQEVDINQAAADVLAMNVDRVGPRQLLGLLSINGELNSINLGTVIESLEAFARQRVVRVVIAFGDSAIQLDSPLQAWLIQVANSGPSEAPENQLFPPLPTGIRELHIAAFPNADSNSTRSNSNTPVNRVHDDLESAVATALSGVYERLPISELIDEIDNGTIVSRSVALASGGGRLPADQLPKLLQLADDNEPRLQIAALRALAHFGEPTAIEKLVHYVRKNSKPTAGVATESLAASRFNAAHDALLEILQNEPPASKKTIVQILARHPRPIWSDTIYEFASDPESGITIEALTALTRIGHPKLYEVLGQSLNQQADRRLSDAAFRLLVSSNRPQADELAVEYTLAHIKNSPPTNEMTQLLKKTKDQRAIAPLVEHLKQGGSSRSAIIDCLVQIGNQEVIDLFVERYSSFETHEQSSVLNALQQMQSPRFRELARQALMSNNSSLISTAARGLQADGSDEAVDMLATTLDSTTNTSALSYITNALGQLGTQRSREALLKARRSGNSTKSRYAKNALRSIEQRSPGYQYVYNARKLEADEKWDEALELYEEAITADGSSSDAYAGRGHVRMKKKLLDEAITDFDKALELDDYNSLAVTGKALTQVMQGKYADGIKTVQDASERLNDDSLYAYNTACVYAQALDWVQQHEDEDDRANKLKRFENEALNHLEQSIKLGFSQKDLIAKDPDLESIRKTERYEKIVHPDKSKESKAEAEAEAQAPVIRRTRPKL